MLARIARVSSPQSGVCESADVDVEHVRDTRARDRRGTGARSMFRALQADDRVALRRAARLAFPCVAIDHLERRGDAPVATRRFERPRDAREALATHQSARTAAR